ncbi:MAG: hypothetical protein ACLF0P_10105 [Thermoanaerobaculia bacterium]
MKNTRWIPVAAGLVLLLATPLAVAAQEHPEEGHEHPQEEQEHPEEGQEHPEEEQEHPEEGQEHPEEGQEHPEEGAGHAELTKEQLADSIEAHIARETRDTGGVYMLDDPETGETLHLELEKIHEERLSKVGEDTYFACVDFVAQDGTTYDVDFFMEGTHAADLEYQEFSIHKVDGVERYTWYEEDGVWKKRPVSEGGY